MSDSPMSDRPRASRQEVGGGTVRTSRPVLQRSPQGTPGRAAVAWTHQQTTPDLHLRPSC